MSKIDRLNTKLAFILRHCPEVKNLKMDAQGWVRISELMANAPEFTEESIKQILNTSSEDRYSISEDGVFIKASKGHTIKLLAS